MKQLTKEETLDNHLQGDDMWPSTKTHVKQAMQAYADQQTASMYSEEEVVAIIEKVKETILSEYNVAYEKIRESTRDYVGYADEGGSWATIELNNEIDKIMNTNFNPTNYLKPKQ